MDDQMRHTWSAVHYEGEPYILDSGGGVALSPTGWLAQCDDRVVRVKTGTATVASLSLSESSRWMGQLAAQGGTAPATLWAGTTGPHGRTPVGRLISIQARRLRQWPLDTYEPLDTCDKGFPQSVGEFADRVATAAATAREACSASLDLAVPLSPPHLDEIAALMRPVAAPTSEAAVHLRDSLVQHVARQVGSCVSDPKATVSLNAFSMLHSCEELAFAGERREEYWDFSYALVEQLEEWHSLLSG